MATYDIFVHPGFPVEEKKIARVPAFKQYCDEVSARASAAECAIHVVDPKVGHHDVFLENIIHDDLRVRSYTLAIPFFPSSYGTICAEDWEKFVGILRHVRKHRDTIRIHGSYHGVCVLDFAVQLYELVYNGKQYLPNTLSCVVDAVFPFSEEDTIEVIKHVMHSHYINSSIRFGTVFAKSDFKQLPAIRKSIVRQMSDNETKVYMQV